MKQESNIIVKAQIVCNKCIVTLNVKVNLEEVTEEKKFNCDKPYTTKHNLKSHKDIKHERNQYETVQEKERILKKENTSCEKKFQCDMCDFTTRWKLSIKRHIEEVHKLIKYPCDKCEYQATQVSNLIRHKQAIHEGKSFRCDLCPKTYSYKGDMKEHKQSFHEGKKYPCSQCEYQATLKRNLKKHIRNIHKGMS